MLSIAQLMASLPRGVATINENRASSHEAAGIAQGEERSTPEFLWSGQPSEHVLSFPDSPCGRVLLEDLVDHGGDNVSRAQVVDTDAIAAPFHGKAARELDDRSLGRVVDGRRHALVGNQATHAGDEQDRPFLLVIEHLACSRGGGVEDAVEVDVHNFLHGRLGVFESGFQVVDAGAGNHAVQPLVGAGNFGKNIIHVLVTADVDTAVFQKSAKLSFTVLLGGKEFGVRAVKSVETID